jgi:hypothetical protein
LERIRQALEYIALKHKDEIESTSIRPGHQASGSPGGGSCSTANSSLSSSNSIRMNLNEIIKELEQCQLNTSIQLNNNLMDSNELETKLIQQNRELINSIKKLTCDKAELRNGILKLEEELWSFRNKKPEVPQPQHHTLSDHDREKVIFFYF